MLIWKLKAQYNYGIMLKKGLGTKKDDNEAFNWIFLSAKQNNMLANYALGNLYYKEKEQNKLQTII